jgi:hypothetical protein
MAARTGNVAFDCDDVLKLAAFWSAVLGRPLDKGSSAFFASIGGADSERREPAWYFNKVPEPKQAKNRVHIDLVDPDRDAVENSSGSAPRSSPNTRYAAITGPSCRTPRATSSASQPRASPALTEQRPGGSC